MSSSTRIARSAVRALATIVIVGTAVSWAIAGWTVTPRGSASLNVAAVANVHELSGVTYLGPAAGGLERFAAVEDSGNQVVQFDVKLAADGTLISATAVSGVTLSPGADYEGIAYTGPARNSVFVSEETTPGVFEHSLSTGARLKTVALPAVFASSRNNLSLESLTRSVSGGVMWTANEAALTIDGPVATAAAGTTVRLQQLTDDGTTVTAGPQFAYQVDPIHSASNPDRSGLSDLVMLPDDTLLALERSAAQTLPAFRNRIYQVDFTGATDISGAAFATGLAGKEFTPVTKTSLWSGQAGGGIGNSGENLEGLALGPALADGHWVLIGVVDDGDPISNNTIVSFEATLSGCALSGDYNCDGRVDAADQTLWQNTFGSSLVLAADGSASGIVDAADYTIWRDSFSTAMGAGGGAQGTIITAVPEPAGTVLLVSGCMIVAAMRLLD